MSDNYDHRVGLFNRIDPSHVITEKNPWGYHDGLAFIPAHGMDQLTFRCPACNNLHSNSFLDEMLCVRCGWRIPDKGTARDIMVEAHNVSVNYGGWTPEVVEHFARAPVPSICNKKTGIFSPVGTVARNLTAFHIAGLEEDIRRSRQKASIIADLRRSAPNYMPSEPWR